MHPGEALRVAKERWAACHIAHRSPEDTEMVNSQAYSNRDRDKCRGEMGCLNKVAEDEGVWVFDDGRRIKHLTSRELANFIRVQTLSHSRDLEPNPQVGVVGSSGDASANHRGLSSRRKIHLSCFGEIGSSVASGPVKPQRVSIRSYSLSNTSTRLHTTQVNERLNRCARKRHVDCVWFLGFSRESPRQKW